MLVALIRVYQKVALINLAVRTAVRVHHKIRKPKTRPCPYARQPGGCSNHFAQQARTVGSVAALSAAMSAMSVCGPGVDSMEWCIRASGPKMMPQRGGYWPESCK